MTSLGKLMCALGGVQISDKTKLVGHNVDVLTRNACVQVLFCVGVLRVRLWSATIMEFLYDSWNYTKGDNLNGNFSNITIYIFTV